MTETLAFEATQGIRDVWPNTELDIPGLDGLGQDTCAKLMLTQGSPAKGSGSRLFSSSQSKKCGSYYCEPHQTCEPSFVGPSCTSKRGGNKNPHG
ncbi:uncharacterized protein [Dermacentor andersoni]|uniref:uncharacterized protein isoform X2 n=1 Tax=Dermacentor andersoni TaxID=34620 RepID=UPI002416F466|nr:uncharacterized protein LOC126522623 isoform X2 [Dermacentor andersoni]XP_054922483.1 uncharacterized protein LOC126522623 isoform X2 [Dermacentor andersoni]XP_054922484.1 uncharacterized protein LOC126522623 isoform X2 [Dermacentor andersoni]XP_054922485.1 uncharacterized protein LOC126522623 isoform X2 [Dermacentor andersoni]XP_054922486.1 uncharacterized protein LOC126522623 isoform X2 [Dermacentor andersoni]